MNFPTQKVAIQVLATDRDKGKNGQITYYVPIGVREFRINGTTGEIYRTGMSLQEKVYVISVTARDHGTPPKSNLAGVNINVSRYIPVFSQPSYTFRVQEEEPSNTFVGAVSAVASGRPVRYVLRGRNLPFKINMTSGVITSEGRLDRERLTNYWFQVEATSGSASATVNVTTYLLDVNDNPPIFVKYIYEVIKLFKVA